jgi:hypothetical protein
MSKRVTIINLPQDSFFSGFSAQRGLWPPRSRGFVITHNDAPLRTPLDE